MLARKGSGGTGDGDGAVRGTFLRLLACCLAASASFDRPVLGGIIFAVRCRRYRPSMFPKPTSSARRVGRHILACAAFTALLVVATYNHGSVTVNDRRIYFHEAVRNAMKSDFWSEFDYDEFKSRFRDSSSGRRGGGEYLKQTLDLQGERSARRTLGVGRDASHSEVRAAYKRLALKYHPDKVGSDATEREAEEAHRRFVEVQAAYEVLSDIEQRRKKREASRQQQQQQQHWGDGGGRSGEQGDGDGTTGGTGGGGGDGRRGRSHGEEM